MFTGFIFHQVHLVESKNWSLSGWASLFAMYALVATVLGARLQRPAWARSSERAVYAVFGLLCLAMLGLEVALLSDRFDLAFVAQISSREQPTAFKLALWGGQAGSLLLWAWMLGVMSFVVVWQNRARNRALALEGRRLVADALGTALPCPDEMIGAMASLPVPETSRFPAPRAASALEHDPLHDALFSEHGIEAAVLTCPAHPGRLLRISAQAYNQRGDYEHLATALEALLAR